MPTQPTSIPIITMDIWHDNTELDLLSIPLNSNNLSLFDTYNIDVDDIQWYTPAPAPSNTTTSPHNNPPAPSQKPSKQA